MSEFFGKAIKSESSVLSPLSSTPCVYYSYKIEERRHSGKKTRWVTIKKGSSSAPFFLDDGTGRILIAPNGADVVIHKDNQFRISMFSNDDAQFLEALYRLGVPVSGKNLRAEEYYIQEEDPLYVLGDVALKGTETEINHENLIVRSSKHTYFIISDRNEKEVLSHFSFISMLMIFGGPILVVFCLHVLLNHFKVM